MKNGIEKQLFFTALQTKDKAAGTVLATIQINLPHSNNWICLCVFVAPFRQHPVAVLQKTTEGWTYKNPETPKHWLEVPIYVHKFLLRTINRLGIIELIGVEVQDHNNRGKLLTGVT